MTLGPKPIHRKMANDLGQLEFDQKPDATAQRLVWLSGMTGLTVVLLAATTAIYLGKSAGSEDIASAQAPVVEVAAATPEAAQPAEPLVVATVAEPCETDLKALAHLSTIYFDKDSAQLDLNDVQKARQVADALKLCPGMTLEVWGHAAGSGDDVASLTISKTRAENTVTALTAMGYATTGIKVVAAGAKMPAAQGDTDDALDRRVEFRIMARP